MSGEKGPTTDVTKEAVLAGWEAVDRNWSDAEAHRRLLALASELDALPWVAARYREALGDPSRAQTARTQAERIVALALNKLSTSRTDQSELPRRVVLALRATAFCFLLIACFFAASILFDCGSTGVRATLVQEATEPANAARLQSP